VKRQVIDVVFAVALLLADTAPVHAQDVTLSVAISMKEAVEELGRGFMAARPGVKLRYNFGSSGELQKQIEAGAPVDLFISAAQRQMEELQAKGLIVVASRKVFARNALTVIKPIDSKIDIAKPADLLDARVTKIVIGNPKTVPAGQYARTSVRPWNTSPAVRWTRASCTPPTPSPARRKSGRRSARRRTRIGRCSTRRPSSPGQRIRPSRRPTWISC
jgi:molybdate transport system substrate-binding protein